MKKFEVTEEEWEFLKEEIPTLAHAAERKASEISRDLNEGSAANLGYSRDESQKLEKKLRLFRSIIHKLRDDTEHDTPTVH